MLSAGDGALSGQNEETNYFMGSKHDSSNCSILNLSVGHGATGSGGCSGDLEELSGSELAAANVETVPGSVPTDLFLAEVFRSDSDPSGPNRSPVVSGALFAEPLSFTNIPRVDPSLVSMGSFLSVPVEDFGVLEPLFSDCPSVAHNYTSRLRAGWGWASKASDFKFGYAFSADLYARGNVLLHWEAGGLDSKFSVEPYPGSLSQLLVGCAVGGTPASVDVTVYSREFHTYSHLLRFVSARSRRLGCSLRAGVLAHFSLAVAGPGGIDYDYLYNLSNHKKFTGGRPETHVFSRGGIFTYSKLPVFSVPGKQIRRKAKPKKETWGIGDII